MNTYKIIVSGFICAVIAIAIYLIFRWDSLEKLYTKDLNSSFNQITATLKKNNDDSLLKEHINKIISVYPDTALIAIKKADNSIKIASKNEKYIINNHLYDSLIKDFKGNGLLPPKGSQFISKYYSKSADEHGENIKFYIFTKTLESDTLLAAFPHSPGKKIITKISLELILIVILTVIITTAFYLLIRPSDNKKQKSADRENVYNEYSADSRTKRSGTDDNGDKALFLDPDKIIINRKEESSQEELTTASLDMLNRAVLQIFRQISNEFSPENLSLYIKITDEIAAKMYELKGKSFLRIDSIDFEQMNLNSDIGKELREGSAILLKEGMNILLPVVHDNSLLGVISVENREKIPGRNISLIKERIQSLSKNISDYIIINDVMKHRKTGLYSKTYFKIRFNELLNRSENSREPFSLIILSIFKNQTLDEAKKFASIKLITSALDREIKNSGIISYVDGRIYFLIPGAATSEADICREKFSAIINRFRIKIDHANVISPEFSIVGYSSDNNQDMNALYSIPEISLI